MTTPPPSVLSTTVLFPPNPHTTSSWSSSRTPHRRHLQHSPPRRTTNTPLLSRRDAALLPFLAASLSPPDPAIALSIGFSGPKDWLRQQKKKSTRFLLAPIDASARTLRSAYLLLMGEESYDANKALEEVKRLLRSATRDCVPLERSPLVAFQANTGVEVCTYRLIVKNASSLLDNTDPTKLEAEAALDVLIRSLTSLSAVVNEADLRLTPSRQKIADALMDSIYFLNKFEQGVKDCLEV